LLRNNNTVAHYFKKLRVICPDAASCLNPEMMMAWNFDVGFQSILSTLKA
jgi:hypothetical protein